jgi:hypothetical protein
MRIPGGDEPQGESLFKPLKADEYRMRVDSFTKHNDKTRFNEDGHDNYRVRLYPEAFADDEEAPLLDTSEQEVSPDKYVVLFFDPKHIGIKGTTVARGRQFLAAVVGVPADAPIELPEFDTWDEVLTSFVGKKVIVAVTAKDGNNQVTAIRGIPRKRQRSIVDSAKEVFKDDVEANSTSDPDDELPF